MMTIFNCGGRESEKHKCDICGKVEVWGKSWGVYGSLNHEDACPEDMPSACSDDCKNELMHRVEIGKFVLPELSCKSCGCEIQQPLGIT